MNTIYLPQQYIQAPHQAVAPLPLDFDTASTSIDQGNQIVEGPFSFCEDIVNDSYYHQFDDQQVVLTTYPMLTPPLETNQPSFIDLESYDMKPIISPEFGHSEIFTGHPSPNLSDNHLYGNLDHHHQEIERPDLKIMIPTAEDVKPFIIKSQSFPPSPPTSPPTPHASSTPKDLKMITSVDIEDENVNLIKQEQNDGNEGEQNELPTYVNPKQYERILKRRIAREKFQKKYNISKERKPFIHQSRHNHAVRRLRGPGGRFLSASETAAAEQQQQQHQVAEMDRRQSLNSTSSSCVSPTTPVSSSTFFNVPTEYPYINSNEHYSTMSAENYLIENNDSWNSTFGTQDMCKNNNFSNMMPSGNVIESSYISNASYENFSQSPLQSVIYHLSSSITNNTQTYY